MFTVLSNTRNSSLYLIAALAVAGVVLLTFAVAPVISASRPVTVPVTVNSEASSDYFWRHPEFRISTAPAVDMSSDFYQRHQEWVSSVEKIVPVTGSTELSDYFQRHLALSAPAGIAVDTADYFVRHPELRTPDTSIDLSDYFLRH